MVEPAPKFRRLSVQQVNDVTVVRPVDTELIGHVVTQELGEELIRLVEQDKSNRTRPIRILLDLSTVRILSSSMLNGLLKLNNAVWRQGGKLVLSSLRPEIQQIMTISHLGGLFHIKPGEAEGLAAF